MCYQITILAYLLRKRKFASLFNLNYFLHTTSTSTLAMPMGQMPCLEVDGRRVHQSLAMCRYVAKQIGCAGKDAFEDLQIDALVDTINEFRLSKFRNCNDLIQLLRKLLWLEIAIVSYEPDDNVKEKKMITLTQEVIPFYLTKMNVIAKENNGHLVLNRVRFISQLICEYMRNYLFLTGNLGWHLLRWYHWLLELSDENRFTRKLPGTSSSRRECFEQRQHQSLHRPETRHRSVSGATVKLYDDAIQPTFFLYRDIFIW